MTKSVKHGIKPPRRPRGESVKVTLANYNLQIKVLIDRCAVLEKERNDANTTASNLRADLIGAILRYDGYIARVKEEGRRREYPPFPPGAI